MKVDDAYAKLDQAMKVWSDYGAQDSEGYHAYDRVIEAGREGNPYPLRGENPWQLYESQPGWQKASVELDRAARQLWKALLERRLGIQIRRIV
jgi:hypothetical protein